MFENKYNVSNKELGLSWDYRSKRKAIKLARHLVYGERHQPLLSVDDQWLVRKIDTGELIDF